jgi:16S rRNA G966 N2-methylase RsmD
VRTIWYMGAKTRLTDAISAAVAEAAPRVNGVLDLMSGSAAVSTALAHDHRVVANDVQAYASAVAAGYLLHDARSKRVLARLNPVADLGVAFEENRALLVEQLAGAIALEDAFLQAAGLDSAARDPQEASRDRSRFEAAAVAPTKRRIPQESRAWASAYRTFALKSTPAFLEERDVRVAGAFRGASGLFKRAAILARRDDPTCFPYHLCSSYYPNVYLGIRQAIDIDSLRYAIDQLAGRNAKLKRDHYLAALLHAASVTTSATSHFCQPRGLVRDSEVTAVLRRRSVSIPSRMLVFSRAIRATVAEIEHRPGNAVRCGGWRELLEGGSPPEVNVVYADPPYTSDNYSRFYHALEVLTRYDYPQLEVHKGKTTKGRYPVIGRRHRSPFCHRRGVEAELAALCQASARLGAGLVLSYAQENGLLFKVYRDQGLSPRRARERFLDLARAAYRDVRLETQTLLHSGQGDSNHQVTELLLIARGPR